MYLKFFSCPLYARLELFFYIAKSAALLLLCVCKILKDCHLVTLESGAVTFFFFFSKDHIIKYCVLPFQILFYSWFYSWLNMRSPNQTKLLSVLVLTCFP